MFFLKHVFLKKNMFFLIKSFFSVCAAATALVLTLKRRDRMAMDLGRPLAGE